VIAARRSGVCLPLRNVRSRNRAVLLGHAVVAQNRPDLRHRLNANDALDREVGLVDLKNVAYMSTSGSFE
jgi:hypothetical protein